MTKVMKYTLLTLALAMLFAFTLVGCVSADTSSSASSSENPVGYVTVSKPPLGNASDSAAAYARAQPFFGTWKASMLLLHAKSSAYDTESVIYVPVTFELNDDMTGTASFGDSTINFKWKVRHWNSLKVDRAVMTIHDTFLLEGLEYDPASMLLELNDTEDAAHLFCHWTSATQPGVKLGIDMTLSRDS